MPKRTVWSDSRGERGRTVTVEERTVGGNVRLRWPREGKFDKDAATPYRTESLGFSIRDDQGRKVQAKVDRALDVRDKKYRQVQARTPDAPVDRKNLTLRKLMDLYDQRHSRRHVKKGTRKRYRARGAAWARFLGVQRHPEDVKKEDVLRYLELRKTGAIDATGRRVRKEKDQRPVGPRTLQKELVFLQGVYSWAQSELVDGDRPLLDRNPVATIKKNNRPSEKNPDQPVASEPLYRALRPVARAHQMEVRWNGSRERQRSYLLDLLDIAHGTGRRISAICGLRHDDLSLEPTEDAPYGSIRWRAETDKTDNEAVVLINEPTREAVERALENCPGPSPGYLFPRPGEPSEPVTQDRAGKWYRDAEQALQERLDRQARAEEKAMKIAWKAPYRKSKNLQELPRVSKAPDLDFPKGRGFHAYRRKWVNDRKHLPDVDLAEAGGWASPDTVRRIYQAPDTPGVRAVVLAGTEDGEGAA